MKKILAFILVLCVLLTSLLPVVSAEPIEDTSAATSHVDVVIVLDQTGSMVDHMDGNTKKDGNDNYGYRMDAAAMLIGMMDMDGSRAAVVSFAQKPLATSELVSLKKDSARQKLLNDYVYTDKTSGNTNIGAALMTACKILNDREDKTNKPMIVLLTDGENTMPGKKDKNKVTIDPSLRWDEAANTIVDNGKEVYDTLLADKVTREAAMCAKALEIPIYTVSLATDRKKEHDGGISLLNIATVTGLDAEKGSKEVSAATAYKLPGFFAEILADRIGSSVKLAAKPSEINVRNTNKKDKNNKPIKEYEYEVNIPVLNSAVLETNIIIPVKTDKVKKSLSAIDADSIQVFNANGHEVGTSDGYSLLKNSKSAFAMVKIRKPDSTGMWKLRFKSEEEVPDAIQFNILYNYDLKLAGKIESVIPDSTEFYKSDTLTIEAYFVKGNGDPSDEDALYKDRSDEPGFEDWMTIRATWELYQANIYGERNSDIIASGMMEADTWFHRFRAEKDLKEESDRLSAGQYLLRIHAEGAGLDRWVEILLTLKNHPPVANPNPYSEAINVNSSEEGKEDTWKPEHTSRDLDVKAPELVTDQDGDKLSFRLLEDNEWTDQAAILDLDPETGIIHVTTLSDGNDGVKAGEARYILHYNDNDAGEQNGIGNVRITVYIESDIEKILKDYEPEMTIDGTPVITGKDRNYKKNTPLTVSVRLKKKDGAGYDSGEIISKLARLLQITDSAGNGKVSGDGLVPDGDALKYTVESTGNKSGDWTIRLALSKWPEITETITIPNDYDPAVVSGAPTGNLVFGCDGERVPGFLRGIIGTDTPEDDASRQVIPSALFSDDDNDILEYSEPVFLVDPASDEKADSDQIWITLDDTSDDDNKTYIIGFNGEKTSLFNYSYQAVMKITATDGDGKPISYTRTVILEDLYNKMLTYLVILAIAVIILIIICLIVHQIRKPVFPKLNMTIREDPSLFESGSEPLSPVKTPTNANAIGVDSDMAARHSISMELLQNIIIRPVRSTTAVGVCVRKSAGGHTVSIEDVQMKARKWYQLHIDEELTIQSDTGDGMIALKLEHRTEDEDDTGMDDFGNDDDWSDGTAAQVRRGHRIGHKVDRKQPVAEDTLPDSDSFDDF